MEPDPEALRTSFKAMSVIFIIMISVINMVLIVKQVRKPLFYQNVKTMIIISLATGDLLLALFPLVVMADIVFDTSTAECSASAISGTYMKYMIHFVFGIGLVTLGAEVLLRHRIYGLNISKGLVSLFVSSIPWILGLVIILPLCLAKVDFENGCSNSQSIQSMLGVSVLFPASLAVVVTAILYFVNFSNLESNTFTNSTISQFAYQQFNNPYPNIEQDTKQGHINGPELNQSPSKQPEVNQYPSNKPGLYSTNTQQKTINFNFGVNLSTNNEAMSTSNRKTEVQILLVIAIVFFLLVVPESALSLSKIAWPNDMTAVVVTLTLYWLKIFRSFITPIIMISYTDL